jgi:hypothetical protein
MDGAADSSNYLKASSGMTVYAVARGTLLYIATWSPGSNGSGANDHFIFVSDQLLPGATALAPWGKAGSIGIAGSKPFLAGESLNNYVGWTNAPITSQAAKSTANSGQMEGVIDLAAAFGSVPSTVYVASAAYGTPNGGALASQCPAGNADGNIDPNEFLSLSIAAIKDENADGRYDRLDPAMDFVVAQVTRNADSSTTLTWNTVPAKNYQVESCDSLGGAWAALTSPMTAATGQLTLSTNDPAGPAARFYRVRLLNP